MHALLRIPSNNKVQSRDNVTYIFNAAKPITYIKEVFGSMPCCVPSNNKVQSRDKVTSIFNAATPIISVYTFI